MTDSREQGALTFPCITNPWLSLWQALNEGMFSKKMNVLDTNNFRSSTKIEIFLTQNMYGNSKYNYVVKLKIPKSIFLFSWLLTWPSASIIPLWESEIWQIILMEHWSEREQKGERILLFRFTTFSWHGIPFSPTSIILIKQPPGPSGCSMPKTCLQSLCWLLRGVALSSDSAGQQQWQLEEGKKGWEL